MDGTELDGNRGKAGRRDLFQGAMILAPARKSKMLHGIRFYEIKSRPLWLGMGRSL